MYLIHRTPQSHHHNLYHEHSHPLQKFPPFFIDCYYFVRVRRSLNMRSTLLVPFRMYHRMLLIIGKVLYSRSQALIHLI